MPVLATARPHDCPFPCAVEVEMRDGRLGAVSPWGGSVFRDVALWVRPAVRPSPAGHG